MPSNTSDQQLLIPVNTDLNDVVTMISNLLLGSATNGAESRLVKRYASVADRTARNATPNEGELSYLLDLNEIDSYDGAAWQYVWSTRAPRGIMAAPISTTTDSSGFGATEAQDTNLGTYTFTGVTGRRYVPKLSNALMASGAVGDTYFLRIRDGGAGAPSNTSTIVSETVATALVSNTNIPISAFPSFTVTSGTHNLGLFIVRQSGANTMNLTSSGHLAGGNRGREFFVEDIGNV